MSKTNPFEAPWQLLDYAKQAFDKHLINPNQWLKHGESTLIAKYNKTNNDGLDVEIYAKLWPADFYTIKFPKTAYEISTGSGMAELVAKMAESFAEGMLGIEKLPQKTPKE